MATVQVVHVLKTRRFDVKPRNYPAVTVGGNNEGFRARTQNPQYSSRVTRACVYYLTSDVNRGRDEERLRRRRRRRLPSWTVSSSSSSVAVLLSSPKPRARRTSLATLETGEPRGCENTISYPSFIFFSKTLSELLVTNFVCTRAFVSPKHERFGINGIQRSSVWLLSTRLVFRRLRARPRHPRSELSRYYRLSEIWHQRPNGDVAVRYER